MNAHDNRECLMPSACGETGFYCANYAGRRSTPSAGGKPTTNALPENVVGALMRHVIKGRPLEGGAEWYCSCDAVAEFDTAEEHIARVTLEACASSPPSLDAWLNLQGERDLAEAYYKTLEEHLRQHGCDHDFAAIANGDAGETTGG